MDIPLEDQEEPTRAHRGQKWQPDRSVNIANLLASAMVVGSFSGWLIFETSRITTLEVEQANAKENISRVAAQSKEDLARVASLLHDNQQDVKAALIRIEDRQLGNNNKPINRNTN